jgi:hypothetical protein
MRRLAILLGLGLCLVVPAAAAAQQAPEPAHVWNVSWRQIVSESGSTTRVPVFMWPYRPGGAPRLQPVPEEIAAIVRVDEQVRAARAARDAGALKPLLASDFSGTDGAGWRFDRDMLLVVIGATTVGDVETLSSTLRTAGNAVTVTGEQLITDAGGTQRTLFTRVYVRNAQTGAWQLFSSAEQRPER